MAVTSSRLENPVAFVHIEKSAGTTFIHVLRNNFFLRYADVRPLCARSNRIFTYHDYKIIKRLWPGTICIGGHAVTPYSDLCRHVPEMDFISIMRDPVRRYLSQYQQWVDKLKHDISFEEFLATESVRNFQTKKFAGSDDLHKARETLATRFSLVGYVEAFDEFLVLLEKHFEAMGFDARYRRQNTANNKVFVDRLLDRYRDEIVEANRSDLALYDYVRNTLFPGYKQAYGPGFDEDVRRFQSRNAGSSPVSAKLYIDYLFRKAYIEPASGLLRLRHGKPYHGSY